jgi:AcrR family transcriptional regulator
MVLGAVDLIRRRGIAATSLRDVVEHTGTPRGSLGYHFPGGKAQLLNDVITCARDHISRSLASALEEHGPILGLQAFSALWRKMLESTDFEAGCAVLPFAVESGVTDPSASPGDRKRLRDHAQEALQEWESLVAMSLQKQGVTAKRAKSLATLTIAAFEGAIALCRASRSVAPLIGVTAELECTFAAAIRKTAT